MSGKDAYGQPTWLDTDPVNLAVDLTTAANSIASGQYRRGTQAQRIATTPVFEGLTWWQTDNTPGQFIYTGGAWQRVQPMLATNFAAAASIVGANWNGTSPLIVRMFHNVVTLSSNSAGRGHGSVTFPAFPNGIIFATAQPIEGAEAATVAWANGGSYASTLSKLEMTFWRANGDLAALGAAVRVQGLIVGW